jgi:hypothetical protein
MKIACVLLLAIGLGSCNTTIGVGRDIKKGYVWSKNKIQEKRQGGGGGGGGSSQDQYGAPIY